MNIQQRKSQRGITFLGLVVLLVILALVVVLGMRVVPSVTEYMAITKAVKKVATDGGTVQEAKANFERAVAVDYIDSISSKDLDIIKSGDKVIVKFAYDKEIPLLGPVYLLIKYRGASTEGYN